MALHIKTDGSVTEVKPAKGKLFTLDELQAMVGGYIEVVGVEQGVTVRDTDKGVKIEPMPGDLLVIDEEGKLKQKPINKTATLLYLYGQHDPIIGDAVLCRAGEID